MLLATVLSLQQAVVIDENTTKTPLRCIKIPSDYRPTHNFSL